MDSSNPAYLFCPKKDKHTLVVYKETHARVRMLATVVGTSIGGMIEYLCKLGFDDISKLTNEELKEDFEKRLKNLGLKTYRGRITGRKSSIQKNLPR